MRGWEQLVRLVAASCANREGPSVPEGAAAIDGVGLQRPATAPGAHTFSHPHLVDQALQAKHNLVAGVGGQALRKGEAAGGAYVGRGEQGARSPSKRGRAQARHRCTHKPRRVVQGEGVHAVRTMNMPHTSEVRTRGGTATSCSLAPPYLWRGEGKDREWQDCWRRRTSAFNPACSC